MHASIYTYFLFSSKIKLSLRFLLFSSKLLMMTDIILKFSLSPSLYFISSGYELFSFSFFLTFISTRIFVTLISFNLLSLNFVFNTHHLVVSVVNVIHTSSHFHLFYFSHTLFLFYFFIIFLFHLFCFRTQSRLKGRVKFI